MKKSIVIVALSLFLSTVVFAQNQKLIFNTQEFSPFNYSVNGKASGPVVDIIKEVCVINSFECIFKVHNWKRAQNIVKIGKADALFVVGKNKKRESWLHFTLPIITTEYGFFVLNSNDLQYKKISDIQGYNVGVFGPSNTSLSLKNIDKKLRSQKLKSLKIRVLEDDIPVFKQLSQAKKGIKAVFSNKDVGNSIIKQNDLQNLRYAGKQRELNYYIALSKRTVSKETVNKFNNTLSNMHKSNRLQEILDNYNLQSATLK